jgi:hypothetical protein
MERRQNPPLHSDRPRGLVNFTLIFALIVAVYGLVSLRMGKDNGVLVVVGLGVAAFNWLSTPREYQIYQDTLVIAYGKPRVRVIPFERISGSPEVLRLVVGDRLRLQLVNGKRVIFQTRDLPTFHDRLAEALSSFRRDHPTVESSNQGPGDQAPS